MPPISLRKVGKRLAEPLPNICILCGEPSVAVWHQTLQDAHNPEQRGKQVDMVLEVDFPVCEKHNKKYGVWSNRFTNLMLLCFPLSLGIAIFGKSLLSADQATMPYILATACIVFSGVIIFPICGRIFRDTFPIAFDRLTPGRLHLFDAPTSFVRAVQRWRAENDPERDAALFEDQSSSDQPGQQPPQGKNPFDFS